MARTTEIRLNLDHIKEWAAEANAALEAAAAEIQRLRAERDEWEERYEDLLSRCGGTMP